MVVNVGREELYRGRWSCCRGSRLLCFRDSGFHALGLLACFFFGIGIGIGILAHVFGMILGCTYGFFIFAKDCGLLFFFFFFWSDSDEGCRCC
ncbi:hypothetical protein EX30DRAFT_166329 [Ascodesmis nigricans]|uniref:Transmembrane protein n=1 Tax=Ascodesmis nigricans TaxID=341454 RepID=A0A4S2MLY2_9PEZI|nr:hypothetical protein EX30DRAFT_166329 [Ascodesmis nigricans]